MTSPARNEKVSEGSINEKDAQVGTSDEIHIDPAAEKRLIRKLDLMLSPMMVLIFLVAYLDRSNIGKSKTHTSIRAPDYMVLTMSR
jgi:hypothetical protein